MRPCWHSNITKKYCFEGKTHFDKTFGQYWLALWEQKNFKEKNKKPYVLFQNLKTEEILIPFLSKCLNSGFLNNFGSQEKLLHMWLLKKMRLGGCGEKSSSKDMKIFFFNFQICHNQFFYLKTQKKSKLLTRESWFEVFLNYGLRTTIKITIFITFNITDNFSSCYSRNSCKKNRIFW